ncbi:MAG: heme ABC exporter ATP-binding protein CcmA [Armatimonadota bacterium]|nr:heme ABC exporter ATP-binding protein CcmA [Armatimonadota bacterium]MDR7452350.1 heme ABC exporter ATP-binding protein CcmA [Armatimonadota bacterium]MDR7466910.1 heme ABC exporter ATP-binding protein CcmA [Armatimonadota bacterium]MDR7493548.1 heme ABC exporter ATP-binding protein CcmA [Armatimonadota bacterium]MDR7498813.1 heme ABC exporter ATP-binding protein CcmA [Armatimonadota bacterium]
MRSQAPSGGSGVLLEVRAVSKSYGRRRALSGVSLTAGVGRVVAVLGPNGAGKSTLLRIAAGITRPDAGEVRVGGHPADDAGVRRRIGFAGHQSLLYGALTVEENLRFYARLYRLDPDHIEEGLTRFGLLPHRRRPVHELSRGLVQRASLARALLHHPPVLVLDEPFTGLDADGAAVLQGVITDLRARGGAVLLATHAWAEARDLADEAVVLVGGRLALADEAEAVDAGRLAAVYGLS